ncbi:hypothetical protein N9Y89_02325 [bacterium]|nr:hypothetical protein [bacterium]
MYAEYLRLFGEIGSKAISSSKDFELYEAIRHLSIVKEDPNTRSRCSIAYTQSRTLDSGNVVNTSAKLFGFGFNPPKEFQHYLKHSFKNTIKLVRHIEEKVIDTLQLEKNIPIKKFHSKYISHMASSNFYPKRGNINESTRLSTSLLFNL